MIEFPGFDPERVRDLNSLIRKQLELDGIDPVQDLAFDAWHCRHRFLPRMLTRSPEACHQLPWRIQLLVTGAHERVFTFPEMFFVHAAAPAAKANPKRTTANFFFISLPPGCSIVAFAGHACLVRAYTS